jgi:ubiquinone/menaquinone biosynthesis C-methylase UbiE
MTINLTAGDFTGLASEYSKNRPDYSPSILKGLLALIPKPISEIDFVDVGAGTGIWTRMVVNAGIKSAIAVEPNLDMRQNGINDSNQAKTKVIWKEGSAEKTSLESNSADFLTMASSFHWADFNLATKEFHRVLRTGGRFTALWNPRLIETNPVLVEIENHLNTLRKDIKRVSSGRSGITETLSEQLWESPYFDDVVYMEGRHDIFMSKERYMGAWRSVNDLRVQLGEDNFKLFLKFVEDKIAPLDGINATYWTRAWSASKKG